jgi:hypothetical protein
LETLKMSTRTALTAALLFAVACGKASAPSIATQPADAAAAAGDTATFTAAASGSSLTYQWLRDGAAIGGATSASYTTPALTAADDNAAYAVRVKNDGGTTVSKAATLRVNWIRIDGQPQETAITVGGPATLSVAASASGTLSYQWKKDGAVLAGAASATYKVATALAIDAGSYTCTVTSTLGGTTTTAQTNAAALTVIGAVAISSQPQSITVSAGSPASFTVLASGRDSLSYQWQKNGANVAGATQPTLTIASAAVADSGTYRVVITASHGQFAAQTISANASLAVATPPTLIGAGDKLLPEGATLSLTAVAKKGQGMSDVAYQWRKNGVDIPDATAANFTLNHPVRPADAGVYGVVVSSAINAFIVTSTASSSISVVAAPIITSQPTGGLTNDHASFTFTVAANAVDTLGFQWTLDGAPIAGATSASYVISDVQLQDYGDYACVVSNTRQGVSATTVSNVATLVSATPQIKTQPANQSARESETATFSIKATGVNLTYQWYRNGVLIPGATSTSYTTPALDLVADQGAVFSCVVSNGIPPDITSNPAVLTVTPFPTQFGSSVASLVKGEGAILTFRFVGTATLDDGSGPVAVQSATSKVVYPIGGTTYTLTVTNHGQDEVNTLAIGVKTYAPTNLYLLNMYPRTVPPQGANPPSDSIARFKVNLIPATPSFPAIYAPTNWGAGAIPDDMKPTGLFPIHVAVSPDESRLYVANNGDATISAFSVAPTTGVLTEIAGSPFAIANDVKPFAGAVDPSGSRYYVACQDGVRVFSIDAATGALTAQPSLDVDMAGRVEGDLLIHPSGRWVYLADHGHNAVHMFTLDATSGALTFVSKATSSGGPTGMTFDRAGSRLFTRGTDSTPIPDPNPNGITFNAAIHVFAVDAFTGALTETSIYHGYGPNYWGPPNFPQGIPAMPFVPGNDAHLHGLAYAGRLDVLYNAYRDDHSSGGQGFSLSSLDVLGGAIDLTPPRLTGDHVVTKNASGKPSPTQLGEGYAFASVGGSVFRDRSGSALVLTTYSGPLYGTSACAYYPVDPATGELQSPTVGFNTEGVLRPGLTPNVYMSNQTHGAFIGAQQ